MNVQINKQLLKDLDLTQSNSYLLIYVSHELSNNPIFYKQDIDSKFIINNFNFIFSHMVYTNIFTTNIFHILIDFMTNHLDIHTQVMFDGIYTIIEIFNKLLLNKTTTRLVLTDILFETCIDTLLLYSHCYFLEYTTQTNTINDKLVELFNNIGPVFIKNYIFHKIRLYESIELNAISFTKAISNNYIIIMICAYVLSSYIIKHKIYYDTNNNVLKSSNLLNIQLYTQSLADTLQQANTSINTNSYFDSIEDIQNSKSDNTLYMYLLNICNLTLRPLYYKLEQIRNNINIIERTIVDLRNNCITTSSYNEIFIQTLEERKHTMDVQYNSFSYLIHSDQLFSKIICIINGLFKRALLNDIPVNPDVINFTVFYLRRLCVRKITATNYMNFAYIIVGLLTILKQNTIGINIYYKCLIIEIINNNKHYITTIINKLDDDQYKMLLMEALSNIYNQVELNKSFDMGEKFLLRYNIHSIYNQLLLGSFFPVIFSQIDLSDMFFLFFQDINYFFEYIIQFMEHHRSLPSQTYVRKMNNYTLYMKESFTLLTHILQYNQNLLFKYNISETVIRNCNSYINIILSRSSGHMYFNFNNVNIYFSWKKDVIEKINIIYGLYKNDVRFYRQFLNKQNNYKSNNLKQIDLFIDKNEDDIHNIHYVSNIDILIENIDTVQACTIIDVRNVPDKFLDPIIMDIIKEPILLPYSDIIVDKLMIYNHLLISKTDPFTQLYLDKDTLDAYNQKEDKIHKIDTFKQEYKQFVDEYLELHSNNSISDFSGDSTVETTSDSSGASAVDTTSDSSGDSTAETTSDSSGDSVSNATFINNAIYTNIDNDTNTY